MWRDSMAELEQIPELLRLEHRFELKSFLPEIQNPILHLGACRSKTSRTSRAPFGLPHDEDRWGGDRMVPIILRGEVKNLSTLRNAAQGDLHQASVKRVLTHV
jgi:hypothetical protein